MSTMERRPKVAKGSIPSNPIYDLDNMVDVAYDKLPTKAAFIKSGYNGADEDEIMDKVINNYATPELDAYGNKTS